MCLHFRAAACGGRLRRQGTAGLRRREVAARSVLTDRNNAAARKCLRDRTRRQARSRAVGLHERTCGTRDCSPPPGGGCGLRRLFLGAANSEFNIQNSELNDSAGHIWFSSQFGLQPAEGACDVKEQRASAAPPGCGPLGPDGPEQRSRLPVAARSISTQSIPQRTAAAARSVLTDRCRRRKRHSGPDRTSSARPAARSRSIGKWLKRSYRVTRLFHCA